MEDYKQLSYPDILIQILRAFLGAFRSRLAPSPDLFSHEWRKIRVTALFHPLQRIRSRISTKNLTREVDALLVELDDLYSQSDTRAAEYSRSSQRESESKDSAAIGGEGLLLSATEEETERQLSGSSARYQQLESKREKVERLLPAFKHLLAKVAKHQSARIILAVDDFYFVRREDQPAVIDYIHRICKDGAAYLKVATIKHRSKLFQRGEIAEGVVPGHEVQVIDLELSLGQLDSVNRFLAAVWANVCREVGISNHREMFKGNAFHQLVLASGGVPRDFFGIASLALGIARERGEHVVGKLRVNEAAREYASRTKFPEVQLDIAPEESERNVLLMDLLRFAREEKRRNCFHIDVDQLDSNPEIRWLLDALVDARLLHLITDNTSNARRAGRFAAYLVDVGLYAHPQRRGERAISEIEFWLRDDSGRLQQLNRAPVYHVRTIDEIRKAAEQIDKVDVEGAIFMPEAEEDPEPIQLYQQMDLLLPTQHD